VAQQLSLFIKTYKMKTKIAIAGLVLTAIAVYFIRRRPSKAEAEPVKKSHHLTSAFSKAKTVAVGS
jgi:hypothetical protein